MKKILKLLSVALLGVCCASCVKEIETPERGPQANPEKDVAGLYEGTWTIKYIIGTDSTTYTIPGTMNLTPDQAGTAYKGLLTSDAVVAEQPILDHNLTSAVNVAPINSAGRYLIYNSVVPNGFDKDITVTKLTDDQKAVVETVISVGGVITGYSLPSTNKTEADAFPDDASHMLTISFQYLYQCDIIRGRKPAKVDYTQDYSFVGYKKK